MDNTLQLFWSSGLHIARNLQYTAQKNTPVNTIKEELSKNQIAGQFLAVFPLFHPTGQSSLLINYSF
ncbi:hypothetical protein [Klebsiella pneumoniae]|uniref:hypothetical protein n=1 Tax=Klebsiella pneumoniae TaxID=573 RepID=UPI00388D0386